MADGTREKGIEMFNTVYCGDLPQPPEPGKDAFFDFMLEGVFGKLWADETLSMRDRRLVLLGAIAAQADRGFEALRSEQFLQTQANAGIVFDDENARFHGDFWATCG